MSEPNRPPTDPLTGPSAPHFPAEIGPDALRPWLRAVIGSLPDAVVLTDADDHVLALNGAAEALCGRTAGDAEGRHVGHLLPGLGAADGAQPLALRNREGRDVRVEALDVPLTVDGTRRGRALVLREVPAEDPLERFARKISHDLRSPIHAVVMMCELLVEDVGAQLPADQLALLHRIIDRVRGLDALVSELARSTTKPPAPPRP